jgi:hypothetical protein
MIGCAGIHDGIKKQLGVFCIIQDKKQIFACLVKLAHWNKIRNIEDGKASINCLLPDRIDASSHQPTQFVRHDMKRPVGWFSLP